MTTAHGVAMLGTGLIGDLYTATLHGQRGRERVHGQDRACGALVAIRSIPDDHAGHSTGSAADEEDLWWRM